MRPATLRGSHRRFCLWSLASRGTRDRPGLVLGLDRGGACCGVAMRLPAMLAIDELHLLWRRRWSSAHRPSWAGPGDGADHRADLHQPPRPSAVREGVAAGRAVGVRHRVRSARRSITQGTRVAGRARHRRSHLERSRRTRRTVGGAGITARDRARAARGNGQSPWVSTVRARPRAAPARRRMGPTICTAIASGLGETVSRYHRGRLLGEIEWIRKRRPAQEIFREPHRPELSPRTPEWKCSESARGRSADGTRIDEPSPAPNAQFVHVER
jgi:hypothetical protein